MGSLLLRNIYKTIQWTLDFQVPTNPRGWHLTKSELLGHRMGTWLPTAILDWLHPVFHTLFVSSWLGLNTLYVTMPLAKNTAPHSRPSTGPINTQYEIYHTGCSRTAQSKHWATSQTRTSQTIRSALLPWWCLAKSFSSTWYPHRDRLWMETSYFSSKRG